MSNHHTPPKRRSWLQWNLQTLLLLTVVVAVWVGYWRLRREIPVLQRDIQAMEQMACELIVEDPEQVAVIRLPALWMNEDRWDVYLPEGDYAIRLATREIGKDGLAPVSVESPIVAGRHRIELRRNQDGDDWTIEVLVDDHPSIQTTEKQDWDSNHGCEGSGVYSTSTQFSPDHPIELQRLRFSKATNPNTSRIPPEPTEGLLLWIQRAGE